MLTPSTLSIPQASTGTCAVSTALLSGVSQDMRFEVSALPKGAHAAFAPPRVIVGQDSVLTISTKNVTAGTYLVTIEAIGTVTRHSAVLTLVVTPSDFSV